MLLLTAILLGCGGAALLVLKASTKVSRRRRASSLTWSPRLSRLEQVDICLRYFRQSGADIRRASDALISFGFDLELRKNNRRMMLAFMEPEHPITSTFCRDLNDVKNKGGGVFEIVVVAHPNAPEDLAVLSERFGVIIVRPADLPALGGAIESAAQFSSGKLRGQKLFDKKFASNDIECLQKETANYYIDMVTGNTTLVVTFEPMSLPRVHANPTRPAWGLSPLVALGVTVVGIKPKQNCWYRRPDLVEFMQQLKVAGFFDAFDRVIFYGGSMGGYGALMFAGLVERSIVLALNPQTTLSKELAPWEPRFGVGKTEDWSDARSDAAVGASAAREVWVCYDPLYRLDRLQVERLATRNLRELKLPGVGHEIPAHLLQMGLLAPVLKGVVRGDLSPAAFPALARKRKEYGPYWARLGMRLRYPAARQAFLDRACALSPDHPDVVQFSDFPYPVVRFECAACAKSWTFDIPRQIKSFGDLSPTGWLDKLRSGCLKNEGCEVLRSVT